MYGYLYPIVSQLHNARILSANACRMSYRSDANFDSLEMTKHLIECEY